MTIYGSDVSHYDASNTTRMFAEGIVFQTHKAGGDTNDPELGSWWSIVKSQPKENVLLGAYWVLLPGRPASRAQDFINRLDSACSGWRDREFILQADCEKWNGRINTVPSKSEIVQFCTALRSLAPKLRPIVYAPKWVYGDSLQGMPCSLWASSYVNGFGTFRSLYPGDTSNRWDDYSGQTPAILQYSSAATIGGQATCDANAFRGTLQELKDLLAPGWRDDMPLNDADVKHVWQSKVVTAPPTLAIEGGVMSPNDMLMRIFNRVDGISKAVPGILTAALNDSQFDTKAFAASVGDYILVKIPQDAASMSKEELKAIVVAGTQDALRLGTGQ